jgi:hypothetical protein
MLFREIGTMGILDNIWKSESRDWVFGAIRPANTPFEINEEKLEARDCYINVILRSLRITHVRVGTNKFYGAIHSFITVPNPIERKREFHVFTSPNRLVELEAPGLDNVMSMETRLVGPTPYLGGDLDLEIALLSIKSTELARPFLSTLEKLSDCASVAFLHSAAPYLEPLSIGVKLLTGVSGASEIEIGISKTITATKTGCFVAMRAPRLSDDEFSQLSLAEDGKLLDASGKLIKNYPYFVFTIQKSDKRDDWFNIEELATSYGRVLSAVREGDINDVTLQFENFKRTTRACPDLLSRDANRIVDLVEEELKDRAIGTLTAGKEVSIRPLSEYKLYT